VNTPHCCKRTFVLKLSGGCLVCPALAEHLLLANHQQDTAGVLPQIHYAAARPHACTQGISLHQCCGTEGGSPAGRGNRRVRGMFTPAVCPCCLDLVISAVAGQTLLTSGVLLHALVTLSTHALLEDGKTSAICVVLLQRGPLVVAGWCQQHPPQAAVMLTCAEPQAGQVGTRCKIPTSVVDRGVNVCQTLSHELLSLLGSNKGSGCGISTALALIRGTVAECLYYKFSTQIH
jgi:hypothetical protein